MSRDQFLFKRQGRYYVRRRVPKDLIDDIRKEHIVRSLFTSDYREATGLAIKAAAEIQNQFDEMRGKISAAFATHDAQLRKLDDLPLREIESIVFSWFRREASRLQNTGPNQTNLEGEVAEAEAEAEAYDLIEEQRQIAQGARDLNRAIVRLIRAEGDEVDRDLTLTMVMICKAEGIACGSSLKGPISSLAHSFVIANRSGSKYRIFRDLVRRGQIQLFRLQVSEMTGQLTEIDDADFRTALKPPYRRKRGAVTLAELIEEFKNDPNRRGMRKKLDLDYGLLFKAMDEVIGHERRLSDITRDDCKEVASLLERLPTNATKRFPNVSLIEAARLREADTNGQYQALNEVTVSSYLHKLSALFNFALVEERMEKNPAKGLRKNSKKHTEDDRFPFADWQLKKIFEAPIFAGCLNDGAGWKHKGENKPRQTKFWIPLIALFHGLRLNEICQMRVADLETHDGVVCFHVKNSGERQRVKTEAGRRLVPLHPFFGPEQLNFDAYVSKIKQQGHDRLFPDLKSDSRGYYSDGFQKWFARFLVASGARPKSDEQSKAKHDPSVFKTSFHSFRHNWRNAFRPTDVPLERARALGGWKGSSTDEKYGTWKTLVGTLQQDIGRVRYPGIEKQLLALCGTP